MTHQIYIDDNDDDSLSISRAFDKHDFDITKLNSSCIKGVTMNGREFVYFVLAKQPNIYTFLCSYILCVKEKGSGVDYFTAQ